MIGEAGPSVVKKLGGQKNYAVFRDFVETIEPDAKGNTNEDPQLVFSDRLIQEVDGIPRFVSSDGYGENFNLQWNTFAKTQLDTYTGLPLSRDRLFAGTEWPLQQLLGQKVLEAGSGAGRFTEILIEGQADLCTFDMSRAIEANYRTNYSKDPSVVYFQGDIYDLPLRRDYFDYVLCYGVLQHTPDPVKAFIHLWSHLKPGGKISIDYYRKFDRATPWSTPKYLWRPVTTRLPPRLLFKIINGYIPYWLPVDTLIRRIGQKLNLPLAAYTIIPCWNYLHLPLSKEERVAWAVLDTFDALANKYDVPRTKEEMYAFQEVLSNVAEYHVKAGGNGWIVNATKALP